MTPPERPMRTVWLAFWSSRLVVVFAGVAGVTQFGLVSGGAAGNDPAGLTAPFGSYLANAIAAPLARWDSVWYLTIAKFGYQAGDQHLSFYPHRLAFFPLYPWLIRALGFITRSDLVAGVLISLVAFAIALFVLHRLVSLDFSEEVARTTVMLVAFSPMAMFFSAVYTESLFLALSLGSIYAARREQWLVAGVFGGLAAVSRNGGIALLLPLAILYMYGPRGSDRAVPTRWAAETVTGLRRLLPRYRLAPDAGWILLVPAALGAYLVYLGIRYGQALAPFQSESYWLRQSTFPLTTILDSARQAWNGLRQLVHGPNPPYYVSGYAQSVISSAFQDVYLFGFLILGLVALVAGLRRLPAAYSAYSFAMLVLALADPVSLQPLASLPRYELVIFPMFIWAAQAITRRNLTVPVIGASAVLLGLFTVEFATWHWVA
jgi:Mannosyltransferase (PIG-V)